MLFVFIGCGSELVDTQIWKSVQRENTRPRKREKKRGRKNGVWSLMFSAILCGVVLGRCGLLRQTFGGCVTPACWCWGKERREKAHTFFLTYACSFLVRSCSGHRPKAGRVEKTMLFSLKLVKLIMLFFFFSYVPSLHAVGSTPFFFFSLVMSALSSLLFFFLPPRLIPAPLTESHDTRNKH